MPVETREVQLPYAKPYQLRTGMTLCLLEISESGCTLSASGHEVDVQIGQLAQDPERFLLSGREVLTIFHKREKIARLRLTAKNCRSVTLSRMS